MRGAAIHKSVALFAYGTLSQASHQRRLFGRADRGEAAVLKGWKKLRCVGVHWGVVPNRLASTSGKLIRLSGQELAAADRWEAVPRLYSRRRLRVWQGAKARIAWVYIPVKPRIRAS